MKYAFVALLTLACAACATAPPPPPDPKSQLPALELRIYDLINARRAVIDAKARELSLDSELVGLARQRSLDMAAKNAYGDGTGDPHISASRLMAEDAAFQGLLGENVGAQRYSKATGINVEQCAAAIVDIWMKSQRHRDNLAFTDYARTGVGAAVSDDTVFVTQLFATSLAVSRAPSGVSPPQRGPVGVHEQQSRP